MNLPASRSTVRVALGVQVWFAPGEYDDPRQIENVFQIMADHHLVIARVSLVWNYLEPAVDDWDFGLFDQVFDAAQRHGVRIAATLWPQGKSPALSGIPDTDESLVAGERYLSTVVAHYRDHPALDTWILMNEPGQSPTVNPLALARFRDWLEKKYGGIDELNQAWLGDSMLPFHAPFHRFEEIDHDPRWSNKGLWPVPGMDWKEFWAEHLGWYLAWVAERVRQIDPDHPLHTNPHGLTHNHATRSFDLPSWRGFLDSLGASVYPLSLFLFGERRSTHGYSFTADLLRGAMEPKPIWITELAAGSIIYSHQHTFTPQPEQIAQWIWTTIGAGTERVILWLLNARWKARETGEFGLLDFLGEPTDRLREVSSIGRAIRENQSFFDAARPADSDITIIVSPETMSLNDQWKQSGSAVPDGRDQHAHLQEALGFHQALSALGIPAAVKHVHDFDWRASSSRPRLAILPHVSVLSAEQAAEIEHFVRAENTVLVSGFTGYYDSRGMFWPMEKSFPLEAVLGARPREIHAVDGDVSLTGPEFSIPGHLWITEIANRGAEVLGSRGEMITAVRNSLGGGHATWLPSLVGLEAFTGDGEPLARFLREFIQPFTAEIPFRFADYEPRCILRALQSEDTYLTVVANTSDKPVDVRLEYPTGLTPSVLWGSSGGTPLSLRPRETVVLRWE